MNGNEYVQIPGSSITLHEDGYAYATNDNGFVANGSRFNSDPTVDATTGEVTDEGWDAINPDGTPRTKNAYYGLRNNLQGEPMDFIVAEITLTFQLLAVRN
ncbi:MAG: GbpC/Spa domain-containing protein [Streptococcus salivarius]